MHHDTVTNQKIEPESEQHHKLIQAAQYLHEQTEASVTLAQLARIVDLSPSNLRRGFLNAYGVTPRAYQANARRQAFREALRQGANVTQATYDAGYGSSSRVVDPSGANLGMTPRQFRQGAPNQHIRWVIGNCKHGALLLAATKRGVCSVQFADHAEGLADALAREFPNATLEQAKEDQTLMDWMQAMQRYLDCHTPSPHLPLDLQGTAFQVRVWQYLLSIPAGETRSYGAVAQAIGQPKAHRAVARACAANRVAALIPCHRVLYANGATGEYRWGRKRKAAMLADEAVAIDPNTA